MRKNVNLTNFVILNFNVASIPYGYIYIHPSKLILLVCPFKETYGDLQWGSCCGCDGPVRKFVREWFKDGGHRDVLHLKILWSSTYTKRFFKEILQHISKWEQLRNSVVGSLNKFAYILTRLIPVVLKSSKFSEKSNVFSFINSSFSL